jgi:hypothetical protein
MRRQQGGCLGAGQGACRSFAEVSYALLCAGRALCNGRDRKKQPKFKNPTNQWVVRSSPAGRARIQGSIPDTWVTVYTGGDMGNTFAAKPDAFNLY